MMRNDESGWVRAYQVMLRLLPQRVRFEAEDEMVEVFRRALAKKRSPMGRVVLLVRGLVDAVATAGWGLTVKRRFKKQGAFRRDLLGATRALRHSPPETMPEPMPHGRMFQLGGCSWSLGDHKRFRC